ncbi:hypothetical protein Poli38472_010115 [Pythium oligandrum]|uniref:Ankyrin repeat-containing domain n=1 Tax=Pythium oligandrum TaxID=41045 RepID=A0A8K1C8W1_PYTOL|nr:hypothetical protein Poli38472_010115 [Pythium oligandrum]|eukprot:TMW58556.1 hypothetical protein Poli38472_010115 [Pythium oligandrum]
MYAAAERGVLADIVWLHRYTDYAANEASVKAASAGHVEVLEWLLDHNTTARKRRALHNTQIEFILRQRESPFQATCWCVASMSYCYIVGVGLLPPRYFVEPDQKLYPLTDWVAKQCGLSLLRRLHEDSMWEATFSEQSMSVSAVNGDLATRDWLLSNGCQYFQDVNSMYEVAAEHGHVDDLDWLYAHISTPENALHALTTALLESQIDAARWFLTHFRDKALTLRGPYHFAIRSGNLETFKFVCEEWGPAPINYIVQAAVYGRYDMVLWLMETQGESIRESQDGTNSLLNAAVSGGNLTLVQWCVEELGASPLTALDAAAKHADIKALQYLVGVLEEEAPLHGDTSQQQANDVVINAVQILAKTARHGEFVEADIQWVLEQFPERDAQLTAGNVAAFVLVHQSPLRETPPWTTTRAFLRYRPRFCCLVPLFPQWVVRFGDLSDLKTLEDIKHPMLYTKETLSCLLKYSRNADIMMRIVAHCDSSVVTMRVACWASKYGAVGLLKLLHQIFTAQNQDRAFFGSVLSSAVRYEQTAVLEWLGCRQHPDTVHLKWCSVAKMAARHGLLSSLLWMLANEKVHVHQMDELMGIVATNGHLRCLRGLEKEL